MRFGRLSLHYEGVLGIGHLVVSHFMHPHNHAVKSIILKNFKLLQNDLDTGGIFSQPLLISFKRDKNIGNFLVRTVFQTSEQPGTFKCAWARCKTCPFIRNVEKISGPKRSIKITDHFTCTLANVIYCQHNLHSLQKVIHRRKIALAVRSVRAWTNDKCLATKHHQTLFCDQTC